MIQFRFVHHILHFPGEPYIQMRLILGLPDERRRCDKFEGVIKMQKIKTFRQAIIDFLNEIIVAISN